MSLCVIKKLSLLTHSLLEVLCSMSVSQRRDEVMSPLFGRSLSSRPRFSLSHSLAHSHTETDASQSLRPEHNNSSHARALHIQMLLYALNYSHCRWALLDHARPRCLTLLFGSAPFGSPSYLSFMNLFDPSQSLRHETSVCRKGNLSLDKYNQNRAVTITTFCFAIYCTKINCDKRYYCHFKTTLFHRLYNYSMTI